MSYIQEIRNLVGTRPLILVSAAVLIVDDEGRLLLQKRRQTGAWHLPGGYLEPGETVEEAARREAREETGLVIADLQLLRVFSGPDFHWFAPNGDEIFNVTVAFEVREFSGTPSADGEEGSEVSFFEPGSIPRRLGPPAPHVLRAYLSTRL